VGQANDLEALTLGLQGQGFQGRSSGDSSELSWEFSVGNTLELSFGLSCTSRFSFSIGRRSEDDIPQGESYRGMDQGRRLFFGPKC
jgi:hypothetical protein